MDEWYEESAVNARASSNAKKYAVINVISVIFGILTLILLIATVYNGFLWFTMRNAGGTEEGAQALNYVRSLTLTFLLGFSFFGGFYLFFFLLKRRINVSYDYVFVSGEIRISKVFNVNRRKYMFSIYPDEILKVGDVDSKSYDRLAENPTNKKIILTPNDLPQSGKFFLYIHATNGTGRALYLLECREQFLVMILKYVKHGTLADDYVMQEKKA